MGISETTNKPAERKVFMVPSKSFYDSFKDYKVRGLLPVEGTPRAQFLEEAYSIIDEAVSMARQSGASPSELEQVRMYATRQVAESSLFFFCVVVLNLYFVNNDYGYRLCLDVQYNKWNKLWVISREFFKSTIITEASTLWEICKDPNQTYCIYSYKEDMAAKFLNVIRGWVENNALIRKMWSDVFWENPALGYEDLPNGTRRRWTWTSTAIEVKRTIESKEKTIEVAGILGSSKTGAHFSRQIFDDTETQKNVETPEAIEKLLSQTLMAFNTGQTEHLEYCFVGTFYARADVYYRMLKDEIFEEAVIQPCVDEEGYPIYFSNDKLEQKYKLMGPAVFATQMMCDPSFNSVSTFKAEWVHYWMPKSDGLNTYLIVDPASGKTGRRHDFTVMLPFGVDALENLMFFDIIRDKIGLEQKFLTLVSLIRQYHPVRIYYEQVSMQQDIHSLEMLMDKYNTRFAITPFNPTKWGDKGSRIEKFRNKCEMGQVWFPNQAVHKNYEGRMEDMMKAFYMEEYLGFPSVPHDDGLDCMASANLLLTDREIQAPIMAQELRRGRKQEAQDDSYDPLRYAINGGFVDYDRDLA